MVDFESLGAVLGPGAPDPDLLRFVLRLSVQDNTKSIQIPYIVLIGCSKSIEIPYVLTLTFPWPRWNHCNYCHLLLWPRLHLTASSTLFNKMPLARDPQTGFFNEMTLCIKGWSSQKK